VKKLLSKCTVCKKLTGKPYKAPEAAALPEFRVKQSSPFDKVGVDFAGPLYVKQGKSMRKVYIALFSCCITRALHLELVEDMFAQTFRRCLRRFTAARDKTSKPKRQFVIKPPSPNATELITTRDKRPSKIASVGQFLQQVPWSDLFSPAQSSEDKLNILTDIINFGLNTIMPVCSLRYMNQIGPG
jgi:hypothetical protein